MNSGDDITKKSTEAVIKPRAFMDADMLIAGSASSKGASDILLRLSELTLIEGVTSLQARVEAERNLQVAPPNVGRSRCILWTISWSRRLRYLGDVHCPDLLPKAFLDLLG